MTTLLLSLAIVLSWGSWIPIAQSVPGARQSTRTLYVTAGNLVFAAIALVVGGSAGQLTLGWKVFWLPLVGGLVWAGGSFCAFRATETIGLARAAGTWTPLNIIVAFILGALLFNELAGITPARYAIMGGCLVLVLVGVFLIIGSQNSADTGDSVTGDSSTADSATGGTGTANSVTGDSSTADFATGDSSTSDSGTVESSTGDSGTGDSSTAESATGDSNPGVSITGESGMGESRTADSATGGSSTGRTGVRATPAVSQRTGFGFAVGAGLLWGAYFVPAQWAHVPSQLGNFPLAVGMFVGAIVLAARDGGIVRPAPRHSAVLLTSGLLFGIGSVALLGLVSRVGTGVGFTIAQLSLLVNASAGIWVFKVPPPGSRAARTAMAGIVLAGVSGTVIGALR